mmetsp:Transcript_21790/g.31617  ORF Transcript_21790/g.31617 Transcript_21790/m.31617 type:complete len:245 (-) Transcript_21790:121-855(-)
MRQHTVRPGQVHGQLEKEVCVVGQVQVHPGALQAESQQHGLLGKHPNVPCSRAVGQHRLDDIQAHGCLGRSVHVQEEVQLGRVLSQLPPQDRHQSNQVHLHQSPGLVCVSALHVLAPLPPDTHLMVVHGCCDELGNGVVAVSAGEQGVLDPLQQRSHRPQHQPHHADRAVCHAYLAEGAHDPLLKKVLQARVRLRGSTQLLVHTEVSVQVGGILLDQHMDDVLDVLLDPTLGKQSSPRLRINFQ